MRLSQTNLNIIDYREIEDNCREQNLFCIFQIIIIIIIYTYYHLIRGVFCCLFCKNVGFFSKKNQGGF
jgi:hypothetical protein